METNLDELEHEKAQMWELFADLMNFDTDFKFTSKELSKNLDYSKQELNKLLFRPRGGYPQKTSASKT